MCECWPCYRSPCDGPVQAETSRSVDSDRTVSDTGLLLVPYFDKGLSMEIAAGTLLTTAQGLLSVCQFLNQKPLKVKCQNVLDFGKGHVCVCISTVFFYERKLMVVCMYCSVIGICNVGFRGKSSVLRRESLLKD